MSENPTDIPYPEMGEYAWAKDLERVTKNSKWIKQDYSGAPLTADQLPKVPINMVLAVLKESLCYPEVMDAYSRCGKNEATPRDQHLVMWYGEYITHKYGNNNNKMPGPSTAMIATLEKLADGTLSGLQDPKVLEELRNEWCIGEDDGENYEQLPAGSDTT